MIHALPPEVAQAYAETTAPDRLSEIRALILEVAETTGTTPLTETLKWGQPAFLPPKRDGTTIRLGASDTHAALYVHCQTSIIAQVQAQFPTEFTYEGNRAVLMPLAEPLNTDALAQVIACALTYHRNKRASA